MRPTRDVKLLRVASIQGHRCGVCSRNAVSFEEIDNLLKR